MSGPTRWGPPPGGAASRAGRAPFWFEPVPLARIFWLRLVVYCFIPLDVALSQSWVRGHARSGADLYQPLRAARILHLPVPTQTSATVLAAMLVVSAVVAASGWRPRLTGTLVAGLYLAWMLVAMSYGKVDHDRLSFLVALAVLPTVGAARAHDHRRAQAAGWALQCIRVAVTLTYFYAAWAKIRFGGWDWPTGATLERALLRRATPLSQFLVDQPHLLVPLQFGMIALELLSPLILLARTDRSRTRVALGLWGFHLSVFAGVSIIFLPHCVAIAAFLPLERWAAVVGQRSTSSVSGRRPRPLPDGRHQDRNVDAM